MEQKAGLIAPRASQLVDDHPETVEPPVAQCRSSPQMSLMHILKKPQVMLGIAHFGNTFQATTQKSISKLLKNIQISLDWMQLCNSSITVEW